VNPPAAVRPRLTLIIPAWNDGAQLSRLIPELVRLKELEEVIVVDASPSLTTSEMVRAAGGIYLPAETPSRGPQMNLGAARASGEVFIFHHADSQLTDRHLQAIRSALRDPAILGGAFHRKFDDRHPCLRPLEGVARLITRYGGSFFGDQSIFVRREIFRTLGGFASFPLMEDLEFSRRLRHAGPVAVLDPPISSSSRRHRERGAWRTTLENFVLICLYRCGCSPTLLHRWYYSTKASRPNETSFPAQSLEELGGR
jgi:rSAM/selenodomain-associated transferase 2